MADCAGGQRWRGRVGQLHQVAGAGRQVPHVLGIASSASPRHPARERADRRRPARSYILQRHRHGWAGVLGDPIGQVLAVVEHRAELEQRALHRPAVAGVGQPGGEGAVAQLAAAAVPRGRRPR